MASLPGVRTAVGSRVGTRPIRRAGLGAGGWWLLGALLATPLSLLPGLLGAAGRFHLVSAAIAAGLHLVWLEAAFDHGFGPRRAARLSGGFLLAFLGALMADLHGIRSEPLRAGSLPLLNASLNGAAALLLLSGAVLARLGRIRAHRRAMVLASAVSACFLAGYVAYHLRADPVAFEGPAAWSAFYHTVLVSHVVLAPLLLPLAGTALLTGLGDRRASHRRTVRWTLPVWLYVSVTGLVVYVLLHG